MLAEIAHAVRTGKVSPLELVDECLRRIERDNPAINAVVTLDAEAARADARGMTAGGRRPAGALAGVPVLVKDLNRVAGMRTTYGSRMFADAPPDTEDDIIVARLRAAGAIIVGKTNTPEFGHTGVTHNKVFGVTRNPWNLDRSPGGSSGGSSAALAAALAPIATSTDGGGSVRGPAAFTGLVGWKPTIGLIGRRPTSRWMNYSTSGSMGHTVADTVLEGSIIAGPAAGDIMGFPMSAAQLGLQRPRRVVAVRTLRNKLDPAVGAAFDAMVTALSDLGYRVEIRDRYTDVDIAKAWILSAAAELGESLAGVKDQWELLEEAVVMQCQYSESITAYQYVTAQRERYLAAEDLDNLLGDDGVLVTPTSNITALPPDAPINALAGALNTMDFNATGHPAVSVPMGLDPDGVPMGFQIIAPRFRDGLALGLAAHIEIARPWPTTAPGYEPFFI
jgi:Asp-tRNA(Asn)/Glu-tRNA(Gln) amidotransferase A subunit family amidase